ncbi:hypothetical protein YIM_36365 [Amycolatopsis sp. YIM 10]|nr:hypothetical protein YIM_36365 [Amycolatopsis sp. YIM 10]
MKVGSVPGVTSVSLRSVEQTTSELRKLLARLREQDPALEAAAVRAAGLAHEHAAVLLALVEHPAADPGILVGGVVPVDRAVTAAELRCFLADAAGPGIREVTQAETTRGYPVVVTERILPGGAQLQAVVLDRAGARAAVFTLHSPSGRGWPDLAAVTGRFVTGVDFSACVL